MQRAYRIVRAGEFDPLTVNDRIVLDQDRRHRRRIMLETEVGRQFLLDLPNATRLRHGDGLVLTDGQLVLVEAADEGLLEITAPTLAALVRIAWHLGNRHLPTQLTGDALRIRADHVIAEMVRGLGGTAVAIRAPFDPEGGAYEHGGDAHADHASGSHHDHHGHHHHGHRHD